MRSNRSNNLHPALRMGMALLAAHGRATVRAVQAALLGPSATAVAADAVTAVGAPRLADSSRSNRGLQTGLQAAMRLLLVARVWPPGPWAVRLRLMWAPLAVPTAVATPPMRRYAPPWLIASHPVVAVLAVAV